MFSTMCLTCALEMHRSGAPYSVDPLERGHNIIQGLAQPILLESEEGLETEVVLRANMDYEMPELVFDDLVIGSRFCPTKAHTHVNLLSIHIHVFKCHILQMTWEERGCSKLLEDRMLHHARRWIYHERTIIGGSGGTASSSSYSFREVVLERVSVPVVDLPDGESAEGLAVQEAKFEAEIEDPSKPETHLEMVVEPEGEAPVEL
ncbi:hypothetical protein M9H77_02216 [Catharanthus roseus]|uniref:Uncharacterized protein n=1 Tax=Catharanthus roseus TaxID=4058 RepID=A0ACC0C7R9_CATRO|nr:hypothetical protein M9H77_02216 [Catharanthus roseus]